MKMFPPHPKSRQFLTPSLDRSSEPKDSRAPDALEKKSSECALTRESKNSFVNSGSVAPESLIPPSEVSLTRRTKSTCSHFLKRETQLVVLFLVIRHRSRLHE